MGYISEENAAPLHFSQPVGGVAEGHGTGTPTGSAEPSPKPTFLSLSLPIPTMYFSRNKEDVFYANWL
ncbi:hypothetical protein ACVVHN_004971, partial [Escherichia coli]